MHLAEHAQSICRCGCGLPYAVSHDDKQTFLVDSVVCYARRALDKIRDKEIEEHKKDANWAVGRHHYAVPAEPNREEASE